MNIDYTGKSIIITGAAGSIGSAAVKLFSRLGGDILAVDIDADGLAALAAGTEGGRVVPLTADITQAAGGRRQATGLWVHPDSAAPYSKTDLAPS